jgi:3'(2'), 5'-bisphosphate nucleotidase
MTDGQLATRMAAGTGRLLLALRDEILVPPAAPALAPPAAPALPPPALGATADRIADALLLALLAHHRPGDAVLCEESHDDHRRLACRRVWIIDPLDGTREYANGLEEFAVHVALIEDGRALAAAVSLPARDELYASDPPPRLPGARKGGRAPRIAVSRSRAPRVAEAVARRLGGETVALGSAGYKTAAVIRGEVDAYLHAGGQYEWDSAAPVAVAQAAGLHASRIDGSPLRYNQPDPRMPDVLICRRELAAALLAAIAAES